jgi:hypothetical protein
VKAECKKQIYLTFLPKRILSYANIGGNPIDCVPERNKKTKKRTPLFGIRFYIID